MIAINYQGELFTWSTSAHMSGGINQRKKRKKKPENRKKKRRLLFSILKKLFLSMNCFSFSEFPLLSLNRSFFLWIASLSLKCASFSESILFSLNHPLLSLNHLLLSLNPFSFLWITSFFSLYLFFFRSIWTWRQNERINNSNKIKWKIHFLFNWRTWIIPCCNQCQKWRVSMGRSKENKKIKEKERINKNRKRSKLQSNWRQNDGRKKETLNRKRKRWKRWRNNKRKW